MCCACPPGGGDSAVIAWSRHGHSLVTWGWDGVLLPRSLGADATLVLPVLPAPALRRPGRRGSSAWVAPVGHRHAWDTDTHGQRYVGMGRGRYRRDGRLPPASRAAAAGRPAAAGRRGRQRTAPARSTRSARPAPSPAAPARLLRARGQPSAAARLLPPPSSPSRRRPARTGARRPEAGAQQLVPAGGNAAVSGARSGKEPRAPHSPRVPQPPQHRDSAFLLLLPSLPPPPPARRAPTARRRHAAPPGRRRAALTLITSPLSGRRRAEVTWFGHVISGAARERLLSSLPAAAALQAAALMARPQQGSASW